MTGTSWRHFSVLWSFMVAGAIGPAFCLLPATLDGAPVAPTGDLPPALVHEADSSSGPSSATSSDGDSTDGGDAESDTMSEVNDGWRAVPGDDLAVEDEPVSSLPDEHLASTSAHMEHFPGMTIQDAFLDTFFRTARLGGMLFGDNTPDPNVITEAQIIKMDELDKELSVDAVQTLYGNVNTTKLHRLMHHLGDELRARGDLWEGDTSTKEKLHGNCKRMFKRSNKRGPGVALQMMRCEEWQSAIIRELLDADQEDAAVASRDGAAAGACSTSAARGGSDGQGGVDNDGGASAGAGASTGGPPSAGADTSACMPPMDTGDLPF